MELISVTVIENVKLSGNSTYKATVRIENNYEIEILHSDLIPYNYENISTEKASLLIAQGINKKYSSIDVLWLQQEIIKKYSQDNFINIYDKAKI